MDETTKPVVAALAKGVRRAMPIVLGYVPIGFAYGVLAGKSGISDANTLLMSLIVFAGSSQFIAVGLFASGTGPAAVILTTFVVNLRHMLMAASLAPFLSGWKKRHLAWFSYELTDETFALHSASAATLSECRLEALSLNMTAQASWVAGTLLGIVASGLIGDVKPLGLDYALAAMFIGLLVGQCENRVRVITAILSGGIATLLYLAGWHQFHIIVATVAGATLGLMVEQWIKR
ncbi:MAG: branched-chain amino acid ABC transporter permease [Desulfobulbaceae bacterium BRH_c16a]|nr:MAG: branched-chain amino acid ABC transporter permease [Desulfobulbaceae bacterium BRH_c16a]